MWLWTVLYNIYQLFNFQTRLSFQMRLVQHLSCIWKASSAHDLYYSPALCEISLVFAGSFTRSVHLITVYLLPFVPSAKLYHRPTSPASFLLCVSCDHTILWSFHACLFCGFCTLLIFLISLLFLLCITITSSLLWFLHPYCTSMQKIWIKYSIIVDSCLLLTSCGTFF